MNTESIVNTAQEFFAWAKSLGAWDTWTGEQRSLRKKILKTLSEKDQYLVKREGVEKFFVEENRLPNGGVGNYASRDSVSPSGRYKLVQSGYGTHPGAWSYSRGEVFRVSDGVRVADVKRNYSSFPFTWMEDHNGHDYLICGDDYQGQTFCQLDTGLVKSHIPEEALDGVGFCWGSHKLLADGKTLLVSGCYWACPYEYRLYDVSNPMEGWPEIVIPPEAGCLYSEEGSTFELVGDSLVWSEGEKIFKDTGERKSAIERVRSEIYHREFKAEKAKDEEALKAARAEGAVLDEKYPDEEEDAHRWVLEVDHRLTFRFSEGKLIMAEEWKSDHKIKKDKEYEIWNRKSRTEREQWILESPLCVALKEKVGTLDGLIGFMYPSQNMKDEGDKNPAYFTLSARKYDPEVERNHHASLEWGVAEGLITLKLWVRGKGDISTPQFPRSTDGILRAWEAAQEHLKAERVS